VFDDDDGAQAAAAAMVVAYHIGRWYLIKPGNGRWFTEGDGVPPAVGPTTAQRRALADFVWHILTPRSDADDWTANAEYRNAADRDDGGSHD
jgi:hypothetical protein